MLTSKKQMATRLNTVLDTELLDRLRQKIITNIFKDKTHEKFSENKAFLKGEDLGDAKGQYEKQIENFYGLTQVPTGIVGPIKVNGAYASGQYHVPMATTEGALIASYNRGAKVLSMSGGVNVLCLSEGITRSPGFVFRNMLESTQFVAWFSENFDVFREIAQETTRHGYLEDFEPKIEGKYVWLNLKFVSGDAAGQNMVTIASDRICKAILQMCPVNPRKWYIDANLSGDKKATRFSMLNGRGKHMIGEVVIPRHLVERVLRTTPEDMVDYCRIALLAGVQTGSIGVNGHFANALAAIFIACGQDAACVAESSVGTSNAELTEKGDLYVSVSLPNLVVGTVGGGTSLPTQREALEIMHCSGQDKAKKFAEIVTATVLAGEISIAGAITAGHFTQAHQKYGRDKKSKKGNTNAISHSVK